MRAQEQPKGSAREDGGVSGVSSSCGASVGFHTRYDGELRERLVWRQEESAQGCIPKRLPGRPDEALGGGNQGPMYLLWAAPALSPLLSRLLPLTSDTG